MNNTMAMKSFYLVVIIMLIFLDSIRAQDLQRNIVSDKIMDYYLNDVGYVALVINQVDTLKVNHDTFVVYFMSSIKGEMIVESYVNGKLSYVGQYSDSPDIFKMLYTVYDPDAFTEVLVIKEYYHPLRDGVWKYFNENGDLINTEFWNNGIKENESKR